MDYERILHKPVIKKHGNKLIIKEVVCRHCLCNRDFEKALQAYEKYKDNIILLAEHIIFVRDNILQRPMLISRVHSCREGHQEVYKNLYGDNWSKHYTTYSGHLYGLAVDFPFYTRDERSKLECELPAGLGIKRFGFTPEYRGKFHFDLWGMHDFQKKYLPNYKEISRIQTWFY